VGQGLLVHRYTEEFARHGQVTGQVLLTLDDVTRRSHYRNAQRTFEKLLELGVVPIVNENDTVATSEIRFGDNDRLAALAAHLVHADLLVLLSDVDGLYDAPPSQSSSTLVPEVHDVRTLEGVRVGRVGAAGVGTGGMATKLEAARIATGAGIPVVLTDLAHAREALAGETTGTLFHPTGRRRPSRLLWLAHATEAKGRIVLDDGAVRALTERRASLLPAGITGVAGGFGAGDPVDLVDERGRVVARGLVNYDAEELPDLLGRSTHELARELGAAYEREVVHRDDLIVL
jgi:glutamate 5-kinase